MGAFVPNLFFCLYGPSLQHIFFLMDKYIKQHVDLEQIDANNVLWYHIPIYIQQSIQYYNTDLAFIFSLYSLSQTCTCY